MVEQKKLCQRSMGQDSSSSVARIWDSQPRGLIFSVRGWASSCAGSKARISSRRVESCTVAVYVCVARKRISSANRGLGGNRLMCWNGAQLLLICRVSSR